MSAIDDIENKTDKDMTPLEWVIHFTYKFTDFAKQAAAELAQLREQSEIDKGMFENCAGQNKILRAGITDYQKAIDFQHNRATEAEREGCKLRAENEKLRQTLCLDDDERPTRLWKLFDDVRKLEVENKQLCALLAEKYEIYLQNCAEINQLRAELDAQTKAVDEARVCLAIYGNPDNWKSHDGYLYLATMGNPWADARTWLTAHSEGRIAYRPDAL